MRYDKLLQELEDIEVLRTLTERRINGLKEYIKKEWESHEFKEPTRYNCTYCKKIVPKIWFTDLSSNERLPYCSEECLKKEREK